MVKATKKSVEINSRPITAFFTRTGTISSSTSTRTISKAAQSTASGSSNGKTRSANSVNESSQSISTATKKPLSRTLAPPYSLAPTTRSRSCTPDITSCPKSPDPMPTGKRKAKFEIDVPNDDENIPTVFVARVPSTPPRKKLRPSPETESPLTASNCQVGKNRAAGVECPGNKEDAMVVDIPPALGLPSPVSSPDLTRKTPSPKPPRHQRPLTPTFIPSQQHTPPRTNGSVGSLPSFSPIAPCTPSSKTADIIAKIKADARAAANLELEEEPTSFEFKDELSDSDDDELCLSLSFMDKGKAKAKESIEVDSTLGSPFKDDTPSSSASTSRYNLRKNIPKAESSSSHSALVSKPSAPKKSLNPLDALLKEKKKADRLGRGSDALLKAEESSSTNHYLHLPDEEYFAMLEASPNRSSLTCGSLDDDEALITNGKRLLGADTGDAIEGILESERQRKLHEVERKRGVSFFVRDDLDSDVFMDPPCRIPVATFHSEHTSLVRLFKTGILSRNIDHITLLLDSRVLVSVDYVQCPGFLSYLFQLALCTDSSSLPSSAFNFLCDLLSIRRPMDDILSLNLVLKTLVRLAGDRQTLMGWPLEQDVQSDRVDNTVRETTLYRLVTLIKHCARASLLPKDELSDLVLLLLLVGMDASMSSRLQSDITLAIDEIFKAVAPESSVDAEAEARICTKLLPYCSKLEPINQVFFVSFLTGGSRQGVRIARWITRSLLLGLTVVAKEEYSERPPLLPLFQELASLSTIPTRPKRFEWNKQTDFVDMGYSTQLLSVALTDVDGYVRDERKKPAAGVAPPPLPSKLQSDDEEKPPTDLELIRKEIELLHSSIGDVRAVNLDRSRVKGMLKQLSMRVHYQQVMAEQARIEGNRKNLLHYFGTKS